MQTTHQTREHLSQKRFRCGLGQGWGVCQKSCPLHPHENSLKAPITRCVETRIHTQAIVHLSCRSVLWRPYLTWPSGMRTNIHCFHLWSGGRSKVRPIKPRQSWFAWPSPCCFHASTAGTTQPPAGLAFTPTSLRQGTSSNCWDCLKPKAVASVENIVRCSSKWKKGLKQERKRNAKTSQETTCFKSIPARSSLVHYVWQHSSKGSRNI